MARTFTAGNLTYDVVKCSREGQYRVIADGSMAGDDLLGFVRKQESDPGWKAAHWQAFDRDHNRLDVVGESTLADAARLVVYSNADFLRRAGMINA